MIPVNANTLHLLWTEQLPNGGITAAVRISLPGTTVYRVYCRYTAEQLWQQVTADLDHKQVERWWAHRTEPKPVHMVTAEALDAEVDALRKAAGW